MVISGKETGVLLTNARSNLDNPLAFRDCIRMLHASIQAELEKHCNRKGR